MKDYYHNDTLYKESNVFIVKNKTNAGDLAKTRYKVFGKDKDDVSLFIDRLILSKDHVPMAIPIRVVGEYYLWHNHFAIRLNTLKDVVKWVDSLKIDKEF